MATTYSVINTSGLECGHHHKSLETAKACGDKLYDSHYIGKYGQRVQSMNQGTWTANAKWHGWKIINNTTGIAMSYEGHKNS